MKNEFPHWCEIFQTPPHTHSMKIGWGDADNTLTIFIYGENVSFSEKLKLLKIIEKEIHQQHPGFILSNLTVDRAGTTFTFHFFNNKIYSRFKRQSL